MSDTGRKLGEALHKAGSKLQVKHLNSAHKALEAKKGKSNQWGELKKKHGPSAMKKDSYWGELNSKVLKNLG